MSPRQAAPRNPASRPAAPAEGPLPDEVASLAELVQALDTLRRRAARGSGRARLSLAEIAARSGIPRSTVHVYLTGRSLPPSDALDTLLQSLGVPPGQLGGWADALDRISTGTPRPARSVPRLLPAPALGFVGREAELRRLDALLLRTDPAEPVPPVAVSGPGGVGKSTLVASWARTRLDTFPDGQLWIDLHGFGPQAPLTPSAALGRLLRALGVDPTGLPADPETRAELFRSSTAGRRLLLVLDNAADSAQVRHLLPGCTGSTVVLTSRTELRTLAVETGAVRLRLRPLSTEAGLALLGPEIPQPVGRQLVAQCAGLPLALRIVRERLAGRDHAEMGRFAGEMADRRARLSVLALSDGGAGIGVRSVLNASYATLPPAEAALFRLLPLCLGRDLELATVAAAAGLDQATARSRLDWLVAVNLLDPAGVDRYAISDLVASFADECRPDDAVAVAAELRLLTHLLAHADALCRMLDVPTRHLVPDGLPEAGFANLPAGLGWLADNLELACQLSLRALERGELELVWPLLNRMLQAAIHRHDLDCLTEPLWRAAGEAAARGRTREQAIMLRGVGISTALAGSLTEARTAFGAVARLAEQVADPGLRDIADTNYALALMLSGDPRESLRRLELVLPLRARLGLSDLDVYNGMISARYMLGELAEAADLAERALRLAAEPGQPRQALALAHFNAAMVVTEHGRDPDRALALVATGYRVLGDARSNNSLLCGANVRALALLAAGRPDEALAVLEPMRALAALASTADVLDTEVLYGRLLALRSPADAVPVLAAAVRRGERWQMPHLQARARVELAAALWATGRPEESREQAEEALAIARRCGFGTVIRRCAELLG
ncbi:MAG TPA: AAA family ATPase [Jatrophihabitans sp.]|nr:AAA family ATPase [Jatrophihabitans sp.]